MLAGASRETAMSIVSARGRTCIVAVGLCAAAALVVESVSAQPAQPEPAQPEPAVPPVAKQPFHPFRPPVVVPPRAPVATVTRLPIAIGTVAGSDTRTVELTDTSGKHRFKVTMSTSKAVDPRIFDYLAKTLRIVELTAAVRADFAAWQKHAGPGAPGADITVSLAAADGASADGFAALPPDGVELIRPGVMRLHEAPTT